MQLCSFNLNKGTRNPELKGPQACWIEKITDKHESALCVQMVTLTTWWISWVGMSIFRLLWFKCARWWHMKSEPCLGCQGFFRQQLASSLQWLCQLQQKASLYLANALLEHINSMNLLRHRNMLSDFIQHIRKIIPHKISFRKELAWERT
jgi:hypothetical protein